MPRYVTQQLAGWGNYPRQICKVYRPERPRDLITTISDTKDQTLIPRGLGRSYGDCALNENAGVLLQTRLNRFLDFDPASGILTCESGVTFADILDVFVPRGFFLPVTPGTKFVTVGGAIAADVHGKNHHKDGSLANFSLDLDLLLSSGQTITCSRDQNRDAFFATLGGMGLTGCILKARLRLIPIQSAYIAVDYRKAADLDAALELSGDDDKYQYAVAWIDCLATGKNLGRSILIRGNHALPTDVPAALSGSPLLVRRRRRKSIPFNFPSFVLNRFTVGAFNNRFYNKHTDSRRIVDYDSFFYPLDSIDHWNRMYGRRGFVQYQALFPPQSARGGLVALLEALANSKRASFLSVLKRTGPSSGGILSYCSPGHTLALDLPFTSDLPEFLRTLDQIVLAHNGRLYLAKDSTTTRETFAAMYPTLPHFREIKSRLDPLNKLSSSQSRRLGITEDS